MKLRGCAYGIHFFVLPDTRWLQRRREEDRQGGGEKEERERGDKKEERKREEGKEGKRRVEMYKNNVQKKKNSDIILCTHMT